METKIIEIITATKIKLRSEQSRSGYSQSAIRYFVNDIEVVRWVYRKSDAGPFTEILSIEYQENDV